MNMPATISEDPIFAAAAVVSAILFLASLGTFFRVMPSVLGSMTRWKANLEIEDSLQFSKSRNIIAAVLFVPLVMIFYNFGIFHPAFLDSVPKLWRFPLVVAIFTFYLVLRSFLNWQLELQNYSSNTFTAANNSFYNFTIILFLTLFVSMMLLKPFQIGDDALRVVLTVIFFISYAFYIYRRGQIFASACGPLPTFLYLCTLEIIPTGMMVITATML